MSKEAFHFVMDMADRFYGHYHRPAEEVWLNWEQTRPVLESAIDPAGRYLYYPRGGTDDPLAKPKLCGMILERHNGPLTFVAHDKGVKLSWDEKVGFYKTFTVVEAEGQHTSNNRVMMYTPYLSLLEPIPDKAWIQPPPKTESGLRMATRRISE